MTYNDLIMNNRPILFFDSGIGGLPYLSHLKDLLACEDFIYVADTKNFPYGEKKSEDLRNIILNTVNSIVKKFNPKAVVIACNTASVTALKQLREIVEVPVVGVVPAIKTASLKTENNKIAILATKRTVEGKYLDNLINEFSSGKDVYKVGASNIVNFVEYDYYNSSKEDIAEYISKSVTELKHTSVDSVVLGCTHFIHVADEIKEALGDNVLVIDSREGVSRQVRRVIELNSGDVIGQGYFYMTKEMDNVSSYKYLCEKAGLKFEGEILV